MKKYSAIVMVVILISLLCSACGSSESSSTDEDTLKVAFLCNGTLGDKSFFDSAASGMDMIEELGVETKIIEAGYDSSKWESALEDVSDEDYDIIIVGTWEMIEPLQNVANDNPDKKYILFDSEMDYTDGAYPNVFSITYRYNEGSFLAGAFASKITTSDMGNANDENVISFIGGIDSPVINDFLVGYIEGAQYTDSDTKIAVSYIGDFEDTAKGKEMALAQYNSEGADVFYAAAGQAGLGALDAAKESSSYAIGMASDQSAIYEESDPEKAEVILTSMMVSVDVSLYDAVERAMNDTLPWGTSESQGIAEGTIVLADNEVYQTAPEEIRTYIEELMEAVQAGEIEIQSAYGMDDATLSELISSVAP